MLRIFVVGLLAVAVCARPLTAQSACIPLGGVCSATDSPCCPPGVYSDAQQQTGCRCIATGTSTTTVVATTSTTVVGETTTTVVGTTTTTIPVVGSMAPLTLTAQDVSVRARGGFDYTTFRGHVPNQYERGLMEAGALGQWVPRAILFMETLPKCAGAVKQAFTTSTLNGITAKLGVAHQYEGRTYPPTRQTWFEKQGGNFYEILGYILEHAHSCALSDPKACAASPLMNADMADLLDLTVDGGVCTDGATFVPANDPPMSDDPNDGLVNGKTIFPKLSAADDALLQTAVDDHMAGECGATAAGSTQTAQLAYAATAPTIDEMNFRTIGPFIGGCAPGMAVADCCQWKLLQHREYLAWAAAERTGDWGLERCASDRHLRMHLAALFAPQGLVIRMPPCDGSYPDDTPPVLASDYLANPTP